MRQAGAIGRISITEEEKLGALSAQEDNHRQHPKLMLLHGTDERWEPTNNGNQRRNRNLQVGTRTNHQQEPEPLKGNQLAEKREPGQSQKPEPVPDENPSMGTGTHPQWEPTSEDQEAGTDDSLEPERIAINIGTADERLRSAYQAMKVEGDRITGRTLSKWAGVRKQTTLEWLQKVQEHGAAPEE